MSGFAAARRLEMARVLWFELPQTYRLLIAGEISDYVASLVVTETRHLDTPTRQDVDAKSRPLGSAKWDREALLHVPAAMPMRPIHTAMCSAVGPNASIAASAYDQLQRP